MYVSGYFSINHKCVREFLTKTSRVVFHAKYNTFHVMHHKLRLQYNKCCSDSAEIKLKFFLLLPYFCIKFILERLLNKYCNIDNVLYTRAELPSARLSASASSLSQPEPRLLIKNLRCAQANGRQGVTSFRPLSFRPGPERQN